MIKAYRDITCDGCQRGWTLSEGENPAHLTKLHGWQTLVGDGEPKHYCPACQAKGKAAEQMELKVEGA